MRRCGWEQWVGRFKRIREGRERAEEWRKERDERRLSKTGRRKALSGAFVVWKEKWIARVEARQAAEREEARREKEAALREARDAVLSLRYRGLAVRSLREWRIRCATKRAEKVVGAGLARRAVEKWVRRVGEVKHRAQVMEEVADEKWAEAEEGRKREKWGWWVRRTALRVKEAELVGAKEDALRREGWEWWREMKCVRSRALRLPTGDVCFSLADNEETTSATSSESPRRTMLDTSPSSPFQRGAIEPLTSLPSPPSPHHTPIRS